MSIKKFETTVNNLQNLVEEWASQFDVKPPIDLRFHLISDTLLAVNGIVLGPVSAIDADGSTYDVEYLHVEAADGSYFEISINWSHDEVCKIGYIKHIKTIYCAAP